MTRYHARWICPISSAPIRDGTLVEQNGRIVFVGPRTGSPPGGDDVELGDVVLVPGLVNAHCHLELTAMRGFLDGLDFLGWINRLTMARRAVLTPSMLLDAARLGVEEGVRHGITTFADTGDTGAGFDAMLESHVRGISYREVFGPDPQHCAAVISALRAKILLMRDRETRLVKAGVSPHAPYTVSDPLFAATAALAREMDVPVAVHIAESRIESELVEEGSGPFAAALRLRGISVVARARSPVALLEKLGVLDLRPLLIHCVRVDASDVDAIARHDCGVAHCPASNAKLGHGIAPLVALLAAQVRVGLGTDSVASNDRMDLLDEARLASLIASARESRHDALSSERVLALSTLGGACALGLDTEIGTLDVGKSADLAAFPVSSVRSPLHDPVSALMCSMAGVQASFVAVAGRVLVRHGVLQGADPGLPARVQSTADRLQEWLRAREN